MLCSLLKIPQPFYKGVIPDAGDTFVVPYGDDKVFMALDASGVHGVTQCKIGDIYGADLQTGKVSIFSQETPKRFGMCLVRPSHDVKFEPEIA